MPGARVRVKLDQFQGLLPNQGDTVIAIGTLADAADGLVVMVSGIYIIH